MPASLEDVLQLLRYELTWLEQSRYSGSQTRLPVINQQPSPFLSNHSCLNFHDPLQRHACRECGLSMFVPSEHLTKDVPCHFIPLDGETVGTLLASGDHERLVSALKKWLRDTIARIEALLESQVGQ